MRNLVLCEKRVVPCPLLADCKAATVEKNFLYFTTKDELCKLDLSKSDSDGENVEILAPLDVGNVIDLKYLPEEDVIAVVASSPGSVSIFDLNTSMLEVVGDVSAGINACCWSPDMEILVIVSGTSLEAGNVLLMTRTWDVLQEIPLVQQDFGEAKFVSVGWGSKETQFHGSEGKDARSKKEIQSTLADWDDRMTRITWRADGLFFAINTVEPNQGYRTIRVFNREGQLQSTSEPVGQLEQSLSWKSSGASGLITSTISLVQQGKRQIAFFEKNGLRHGEFEIPTSQQVLETSWNGDSSILTVLSRAGQSEYTLQLWTVSNYQWYMKHVMRFEENARPLWISWDIIGTNRLHIVTANGNYSTMEYQNVVVATKGLTSTDPGCIAIVDNCKLKLTFFRETIIPPPMCGWEVELPDPIHSIDTITSDSSQMCVVTHGSSVHLFQLDTNEKASELQGVKIVQKEGRSLRPNWVRSYSLNLPNYADFYHWRWVNSSIMAACSINQVVLLQCKHDTIVVRDYLKMESPVGGLVTSRSNNNIIIIHLTNGKTFQLSTEDMKLTPMINFPEYCAQLELIGDKLIGLAASGRLYVDGKEILSAVSSFTVTLDFLLVTSLLKHQLLCVPLDRLVSSIPFPTERAVERGSKLVHAVAASTAVVLQMPRGNLETVHPRALSLAVVKTLIDRQAYGEAFELMKKQRINLNLFYDHDPQHFLAHCDQFVVQISSKDVSNLNLFLGELQNEDFTATMYQTHYQNRTNAAISDKIKTVCPKLREIMDELDSQKYLLPILTSLIKQSMLPAALKRVQSLPDESTKDYALKYMAVLVDGDQLYKDALATYDLQLTLMVAHRSQKDPKEYLPFLNDLNSMTDENERRFTIDNSIKRYDSAVRHLCRCRPVRTEQILSFAKLQRVYAPVVEELSVAPDGEGKEALQSAAVLLAESLTARDNHEEAGYLFQRVGLYQRALDSFKLCGLWNNCLAMASSLQMSPTDVIALVSKLVILLRSKKNYMNAAHLADHYLKDYKLSGECLVEGLYFSEAWALVHKYNLDDWKETYLKNELSEAFDAMQVKLDSVEEECCKYSSRLAVVRCDLLHKLENPTIADTDHADLYSETGSSIFTHTTGVSSRTNASSKNRRKHERKKLRLKEGSPFEDLAIINQLHVLFSSLGGLVGEVGRLLRGELLLSKDWARAKLLQSRTESLLKLFEEKKKEIWDFALINNSIEKNYGPAATTEMIITRIGKEKEEYFATRYLELDSKIRTPPDAPDGSWKLEGLK